MMKKQIFKIMMVVFLLLVFGISNVKANETISEETTYTVTVTAKHNNRPISNIPVMISQNGETIIYENTNSRGVVTFELSDGDYTAVAGNTYGDYSYYGIVEFTVDGDDISITIDVDSELSWEAAEEIYDNTSYYNHVDIRVNGTFTTGTTENPTTHSIKLKNVELLVVNDSNNDGTISQSETLIDTTFSDNTETYEWRVTGKRIPKTAVVSLIMDIYLDGAEEPFRENFTYSYDGNTEEGKEDFIQAIIDCDQNQGLDFIIDPSELIEAIFYNVSYEWTGLPNDLPEGLATLPNSTDGYAPGDEHTIDTKWTEGVYIVNGNMSYTFTGWKTWSNKADNHATKNDISTGTNTLDIDEDTIIYGVWTAQEIPQEPTSNYLVIEKTFGGNDGYIPEGLYFIVRDPNGYVVEIPYSLFTNGKYELEIFATGDYIVEECNYNIPGYRLTSTVTSKTINVLNLNNEVNATFINTYEKKTGTDIHNYPSFVIEKADSLTLSPLSGAEFTLTDKDGVQTVSSPTTESGYAIFRDLKAGTYTLTETTAPLGYYKDDTVYTVTVTATRLDVQEYDESQDAYVWVYDYTVAITPNDHFNANVLRLTVFNEKITGSLTISKEFSTDSDINKDNFPEDKEVKISVTGDNNYSETVVLNSSNNWTETLTGLELGNYVIKEIIDEVNIDGYELKVNYGSDSDMVEVSLTENDNEEEVTITNTYTKNVGTGEDEDKNNDIPLTGDNSKFYVYFMLTLVSVVGLAITIVKDRKCFISK